MIKKVTEDIKLNTVILFLQRWVRPYVVLIYIVTLFGKL